MQDLYVLFDLDGTLVDSAPDLHGALNHSLTRAGRDLIDIAQVRHMVGQGARVLLERGLTATGGMPSAEIFEELVEEFFDYYEDHLIDHSVPYEGVVTSLELFKKAGVTMGVCTNKPMRFAVPLLQQMGLSKFFTATTGGDSFEVRKPDAGHINGTLEEMNFTKGTALMVGDSDSDISAARNAGIPSIAVTFGYTEIPVSDLNPTHIIDHFDELYPLVTKITRS
ncbi:phosphoglycolate phosphatase [Sneathiella marina]|uniref:Phosphoglycolate phosphatase n=1 Tax=Sneathiella marina TaxID=2950108 RepID=A0ABY4W7R3_9PROT|nr:phosphoglycolate phosphatase [Sneathiella marina]USG63231.1 phosphoglycolate phosphatase [Sneathiella marina]